jgi:predicted nucleic acid-binding protein
MPTNPVIFIDTTVLAALLRVPGRDENAAELQNEFKQLQADGAKFVIPMTSIIETGNLIANGPGDRRAAAGRLAEAIEAARSQSPPWTIRDVSWDDRFLAALLDGDSTGSDMVTNLGNGIMGNGDLAILVERDRFRQESAFGDIRVWSTDGHLRAHS